MYIKFKKIKIESTYKKKEVKDCFISIDSIKFSKVIKIIVVFVLIYIFFKIKKKKFDNCIHIAVNIDENYIFPFLVYLTSLLVNKANSSFYTIHILANNITKESHNKIEKILNKYDKNSIKVEYHKPKNYFHNIEIEYYPITICYRILLPSLAPNVDKIIYTDVDVINFEDLSEMYNKELNDNIYFSGTLDYTDHLIRLNEDGIKTNKFINSGIMLMNLKAMRANKIEKKLIEFTLTLKGFFIDQIAINTVCCNNIKVLSYKYGIFSFNSFDELVELNNQQYDIYKFNESVLTLSPPNL